MNKNFEIDKQTLNDLNILGKYKNNSIYSLFAIRLLMAANCCWNKCLIIR